ncbi:MAG: c-type cytochrome [Arenicellales bacterium]|nr:c-type cytochrome [Arenicellales bacterium]
MQSSRTQIAKAMLVAIFTIVALIARQDAKAQASDRSGKEVVDVVCSACHDEGIQGAPKIGDAQAWIKRASQGLTTLTQHAINGIRQMPAHGGNPGVTDFEIKLAITYMVNQSGGAWTMPIDKSASRAEHSGEQIAQAQCAKCHQTGEGGAPKIGDMTAWLPRLQQGLDALVLSAINGHGGMPPRGGMVNLTDDELRNAVIYLFAPTSTPVKESPPVTSSKASDPYHKVIGGMDVYLGIVPAGSASSEEREMHGGVPSGTGYYHVNVSLLDNETNDQITDAQVEVIVKDPFMGDKSKELERMKINEKISYGNYVQMTGWDKYSIKVRIQRPDMPRAVSANFDFRP